MFLKTPNARGLSAKCSCLLCWDREQLRGGPWTSTSPPPACRFDAETTSWSCSRTPRSPSVLSPLSLSCAHPAEHPPPPPWPSPSAAARSRPELRRLAVDLRRTARSLPAEGIGPGCSESAPLAAVSLQDPTSPPPKYAAACPPPAKPSPPAISW
jgi:hypothetical protein